MFSNKQGWCLPENLYGVGQPGIPGSGRSHSAQRLLSACTTRCLRWCPAGWRCWWGLLSSHRAGAALHWQGCPQACSSVRPPRLAKHRTMLARVPVLCSHLSSSPPAHTLGFKLKMMMYLLLSKVYKKLGVNTEFNKITKSALKHKARVFHLTELKVTQGQFMCEVADLCLLTLHWKS